MSNNKYAYGWDGHIITSNGSPEIPTVNEPAMHTHRFPDSHLLHPKPQKILRTIMPPATTPRTVLEQIKQDVDFSRMQSRPGGPEVAVMTSISVLEQLVARVELLEWMRGNVGNIDFHVKAPAGVLCTNPWIAIGANFEEAVAKARDQLTALTTERAVGRDNEEIIRD